ncbi:MAG: CusA/CzcA family heavy metal efflux RND transporter [Salinivirgaceae bacterium]|nr:CusA/CzcA family heavy metal efflux RND transporter [Salinivirgaceae bacterium]
MLEKIINFSIRNKLIVVLFTITVAAFGIFAITQIPVGAVPDITNNQVQVITTSTNLSTQEIEQFITGPVELEMANLPGVIEIRSISKFGLSVVTIVFEDNMGTYLPRQLIAEKIKAAAANIPEGFGTPEMGPITTGLGEIYQYILDVKPGYEDRYSAMELRTVQDWIVRRQLSGIKGVVEVNSWGGFLKQYEVSIDPTVLSSFNISLAEVYTALENNNNISGGAYIEKTNQSYFIRGDGQVKSLDDIKQIVVKNNDGVSILIGDLSDVKFGYANRFGAITANGQGEKVLGQIMMLKDANSKEVIAEVKTRIEEVQKSLPEGVFINPILERSELITRTTHTVIENLVLGCLIVIFIVVLILGNMRSALVIASMIPLALLFTISMMYVFGIDANLMSLGALDFGIIIDGAVIIVEFIALKITNSSEEFKGLTGDSRQQLFDKISFTGASKMMNSAIFGQVIILIVFIPILSLKGVEGKMFRPMALSFSFAIIGAMIFGLTWLPVAASTFLRPEKEKKRSLSKWIMNQLEQSYTYVMQWACNKKRWVLGIAFASLVFTGFLFSKMGGEFVPTLDEGDFVIQPVLKTGTSLTKTVEITTQMEQILIDKFPEVDQIVCRIGAAEVPTDPMSMEEIDMIIKLNPKSEWIHAKSKEELADKFKEELSVIPGIEYEFTQPIEMRFNELITGVRADIAVKVYGEDLDYLNEKASQIKDLIEDVPGVGDNILEKTDGLPQMSVVYNRAKVAFYGLEIKTLNDYLAMAFGGAEAGSIFEGEKRFDLVVRLQKQNRTDIEDIRQLKIPLQNGSEIPLQEVADITYTEGPAKISRDNTQRRVVVSVNVRNRDLQSVVEDIQQKISENIKLKPGYYIEYGGQFENLKNATKRLVLAVPIALLLIFIFLHFAFKSFKDASMIFMAVPLATVGGVMSLWIRGLPFSVSAGIGFIALFGIAILNGIVLIEHLKELRFSEKDNMRALILKGTKDRLRPVLLTASAAALGFLPMAISNGAGAEVQRPLATVVIGGLISSTLLTMVALPLLFEIFYSIKRIQIFPFRIIRHKVLPLILILLSISVLSGAQTNDISLEQAMKIAIDNNEALKADKIAYEKQRVLEKTAFSIDKTQFYYGFDENNVAENGHPLNILGVEQSFSFPSLYLAQKKSLKLNTEISALVYQKQEQQLKRQVSLAYVRLIAVTHKFNLYDNLDSIYMQIIKKAEMSYEKGELSRLNYLNYVSKHQLIKSQKSELLITLEQEKSRLNLLMNTREDFAYDQMPFEVLKTDSVYLDSLVDIKIQRAQMDYNKALVAIEKSKFLPDFTLSYYNGTNNYESKKNYNGFQVGIQLPIFYGEQKAILKSEKMNLESQQYLLNQAIKDLRAKHKSFYYEIKYQKQLIENFEQHNLKLSDELLRAAQKELNMGEINYFEYSQAIENATLLKFDYFKLLAKYNELAIELTYLTY